MDEMQCSIALLPNLSYVGIFGTFTHQQMCVCVWNAVS